MSGVSERDSVATPTIDQIAAAIRKTESNNNYTAQNPSSSASGAYQYIDSTWNNYAGYRHAKDAPPSVQDQRAHADIAAKLELYGGDIRKVVQSWYYPKGVGQENLRPPGANTLTMGQYADKVLKNMGVTTTIPSASKFADAPPLQLASAKDDNPCILRTPNFIPFIKEPCLLRQSDGRAIGGASLLVVGSVVMLVGIVLLVQAAGVSQATKIISGPAGKLGNKLRPSGKGTEIESEQLNDNGSVSQRSGEERSKPPWRTIQGRRVLGGRMVDINEDEESF